MFDLSHPLFAARLALTKRWTHHLLHHRDVTNASFGTVLRSINPVVKGEPLYHFDQDYVTWNIDVYDVSNFQDALAQALHVRDVPERGAESEGRILCFTTELTTHDGAAIAASDCFMDESDVPPIDTWFYLIEDVPELYRRSALFCWIPECCVAAVEQAIVVEMMESYFWIEEPMADAVPGQ